MWACMCVYVVCECVRWECVCVSGCECVGGAFGCEYFRVSVNVCVFQCVFWMFLVCECFE